MAYFKKKLHLRRTIFPIFAHKNQFAGQMTQVIRKSISKMFLGIFLFQKLLEIWHSGDFLVPNVQSD
jgi:hypothetical protein